MKLIHIELQIFNKNFVIYTSLKKNKSMASSKRPIIEYDFCENFPNKFLEKSKALTNIIGSRILTSYLQDNVVNELMKPNFISIM